MTLAVRAVPGGVEFAVKAVPGAARERIVGLLGDHLKVAVAAPPEKGKANERICAVLAAALGVPPAAVQVTVGASGPRKRVRVLGVTAGDVAVRLGLQPQ